MNFTHNIAKSGERSHCNRLQADGVVLLSGFVPALAGDGFSVGFGAVR
jgi:hypothetical protein